MSGTIVTRNQRTWVAVCSLFVVTLFLSGSAAVAQESLNVDFAKQIQPILAKRCFKCHGPDLAEGGLRLDTAEGLVAELDSGEIGIVAGEPDRSEVLNRIRSDDESLRMPVDEKPLSHEEAALIEAWIKEGATWEEHWAFRTLDPVAVPEVRNAAWVVSPIDAFVLQGLERRGLSPASPASKVALIRRVYYDLIGLPPTPAEVDAFIADESPDAYERLIDRLLESDQYGEKWARHWLDVVRYAETNGYERDGRKDSIWKYRDYVIRSFNDDKPFDRFVMEQLAGDELPDASPDSITATGYQRLGIWDDEPADRELARYDYLDDLVRTTGEAFLGMTIGCARCHDHKIDPISQRDYYSMVAFFSDISDHGSGETNLVRIDTAEERAEFEQRVVQKQERQQQLRDQIAQLETTWINQVKERFPEQAKELLEAAAKASPVDLATSVNEAQTWRYMMERPADEWFQIGFDDSQWPMGPGGFGRTGTPGAVVRTDWHTHHIWLRRDFRLEQVPSKVVLQLHHDEDVEVYLNGQLVFEERGFGSEYRDHDISKAAVTALQTGKNVLAIHCRQTGGGQYIDAGLKLDGTNVIEQIITQYGDELLEADSIVAWNNAKGELAASQAEKLEFRPAMAMAIAEKGPQTTWLLQRGLPAMKGDEVSPAFPHILDPPAAEIVAPESGRTSGKRLALARWIVSPENPIAARVMANRIWQHHFGRGIVRSASDFGFQGTPPTHPALLDWLADDLRSHDWKIKRMHKLIMMSNTYRMSATSNPQALAIDPTNELLWRFDMRRLTAEEVRDSILAVGGSLNLEMFGPSVFPPLPQEVLATSSNPGGAWGDATAADAARRTIYVHVKRSLRPPMLANFDAADTDSSCPVRMTTTVPTQALGMLNSDFMVEQALEFSQRLALEAGADPAARMALAIRLISGRVATDAEIADDLKFLAEMQSAESLTEEKAWQVYCLMLLNTNEFVYLD